MRKKFYLKAKSNKSSAKIAEQILNINDYIENRYNISVIDMAVSWDDDHFMRSYIIILITYEDLS